MSKYWYVYKRFGGPPIFQHASYLGAVEEAKRLVDTVGGEFEILEAVSVVKAAPKHFIEILRINAYTTTDPDNIPF